MYLLEFDLKGLPKLTNQVARSHWRTQYGHANGWKTKVFAKAWPLKPESPLVKANLTLTRYSSREPDFDGLVSGFKHVIDGLKQAHIISDDKVSIIGQPVYLWVKCNPKFGKITIKVEGIE